MAEDLKSIPTIEGQEAPKDALSALIKKLGIQDNIIIEINKLSQEDKEELEVSLRKIQKEVEEEKLGPTDQDQKIKNTLAGKYGITLLEGSTISTVVGSVKEATKGLEEQHRLLGERLTKIKKLDSVVGKELEIAKAKNPLPEDVKLSIAKASNIEPSKIDEAIQNKNPQVENLVDTYYLSQQETIEAIKSKLPDGKKIGNEFQELRASAREFGLPYTERADNVKSLITNQSDATQGKIIETVNSLTKGAPDTMITRTGDKLSFQDPKDDRYTYDIDMDKKPLVLTKKLGGLSISRELGEARDPIREKNDKTRAEVTTLVRGLNEKKKEVLSSTMKDGTQVVSEGFSGVVSNTLSQLTLRDPAGADFSRKMIDTGANVISMEKGRLEKLVTEKKTKDLLDSDIGAIQGAIREIDALLESMQRVRDKCIIQIEDPKNNHALWEKNTNDTLRTLVGLGFDELGQENLDALMRGISTRDNQRGIWQTGQLDMTDSFTMDKQLLDMQDIVTTLRKNSGKNERETMQDIGNSISKNEGFRNMWNNRRALSKWIQDQGNAPATKFTQNTVAGANSENR